MFEPLLYLFLWWKAEAGEVEGWGRQAVCKRLQSLVGEREKQPRQKQSLSHEKKEILPFMVTRLDLQDNTLSRVNQREKVKNYEVSLISVIEQTQLVKRE